MASTYSRNECHAYVQDQIKLFDAIIPTAGATAVGLGPGIWAGFDL